MLLILTILHVVLVTQVEGWKGVVGRVEVRAEINQRYSATLARVTLHNPANRTDHVTLALLLPADALVSSLTMETGGRNITTKVQEKEKAQGQKTSRNQQSTSGGRRVATQETQKFKASIEVAPLDHATFYVFYEQLLQRVQGRYTYTVHLPPYAGTGEQRVEVRVKEAAVIRNLQVLQQPSPPSVREEITKDNEIILTYHRGGGGGGGREGERDEEEDGDEKVEANIPNHINTDSSNRNNNSNVNVTTSGNSTNSNSSSSITSSSSNSSREVAVSSRSRRSVANESNGMKDKNRLSINYDAERATDGGEIQVLGRFFVHYLSPEGLPKLPAHTVFALDVSGSMSDHGKLDQLKKAIIAIIRGMPAEDSFEVLAFSTRVRSLGVYRALPGEVEEGVAKIQALQALGGTNINEALLQAVTGANTHNSTHAPARQVVFLTDGKPNIGETRPEQLRRNVREANRHQLPVFSLALGQDADVRLLRQVAADNEGFMRAIDEDGQTAEELQEFYGEISSPLLTDVDVMYSEEEVDRNSVIRYGPTNFYSGSEVVLAGQLREGARAVHPVVAGRGKEGPLQLRVSRTYTTEEPPVRDNHVERLWAYLTVQDLLDAVEIVDDRNLRVEMKARAKEIAVRFQFVTKLTTLKVEDGIGSQTHPGLKSAANPHRETGIGPEYTLLSPSEIAQTLPAPLSSRIRASAPSSSPYFGDNDPHFVVQVPGMPLPLCFDIHASHGSALTLIRDPHSGVLVNGEVTEAVGRPGNTYFTTIFISLAGVNFTITTTDVKVDCLDAHGHPTVDHVASALWPNKKQRAGKRRHKGRKEERAKRKSLRRADRRRRRDRRERKENRAAERHMAKERRKSRQRRRSRRSMRGSGHVNGGPEAVNVLQRYYFRRRRRRPGQAILPLRPHKQTPSNVTLSRQVRESPPFHPQAGAFLHPQAGVDISSPRLRHTPRGGGHEVGVEDAGEKVQRECGGRSLSWKKVSERRYGQVMVTLRNHRKLDFLLGDVSLNLVVTRSRSGHGQHFLGVYLERRALLSPNTTGIIGQFVYKTVGTVGNHGPGVNRVPNQLDQKVRLAVVQPGPQRRYQVSEVNAFLSSRRSLLHKTQVTCLYIRDQGRGLVAGLPEDYVLPCLEC